MKFIEGSPVSLAALHRAMVGELERCQQDTLPKVNSVAGGDGLPSRNSIRKEEILNSSPQRLPLSLSTLILIHKLHLR